MLALKSFMKGGSSLTKRVRLSVLSKGRMTGPSEKLFLLSSLSNHMFIAVKSLMLWPARGCILCIVAATTVVSFDWLVLISDSKKTDNLADSAKVLRQL